jgi:hypothetical protein
VDGVPMVSPGPGAALVLANTTTKPLTGSSDDLSFPTTGQFFMLSRYPVALDVYPHWAVHCFGVCSSQACQECRT